MSLAIAPRSAAGRWGLVFAALAVLETLAALAELAPFLGLAPDAWAWSGLGQACPAPATAAAALGLVGIIHYRERSALAWATTAVALGFAVWAAWLVLSATARPY